MLNWLFKRKAEPEPKQFGPVRDPAIEEEIMAGLMVGATPEQRARTAELNWKKLEWYLSDEYLYGKR